MTTYHMCGDILGAVMNEKLGSLKAFTNDDGTPASTAQVLAFFKEEMLKGHAYYVFGGCDNRLPNGRCAGHESK